MAVADPQEGELVVLVCDLLLQVLSVDQGLSFRVGEDQVMRSTDISLVSKEVGMSFLWMSHHLDYCPRLWFGVANSFLDVWF